MKNQIEIYKSSDNQIELNVQFDGDTVWLTQKNMAELFEQTKQNISLHINNCFKEVELSPNSVVKESLTTASDGKKYRTKYYNLDVIISVGYRVKSQRGTQFRQWVSQRLKDYLVQGYAVNEERLNQKNQEIQYLKTSIRIISRALEQKSNYEEDTMLHIFAKGLTLLDDYDHDQLDQTGLTSTDAVYPGYEEYQTLIFRMKTEYTSDIFGLPKDKSFKSSINQIKQTFNGKELYESLEEKAATLLYLIVKNHSFVDGNKRIAAACFLYFLKQNNLLLKDSGEPFISNETLASLTLFIAISNPDEMKTVKRLTISVLNRSQVNE